ncbi:hypothetical protein KO507_04330 [Gilvimarinus agarilyticus]|uniref:hypothetical protein n=1 Tax=Gilvimarinus sp. 2_MG-2023 TaxID=3062666 RepID=UPI001C095A85|nr:hypothetical protein [Gilvimarinus sp. 2_MG-2023]MBU2884992.1 hypothetical protein [Gilvimarinus agarilyticus]MDO6569889.1 hypothetical protein [Gilvimarinus sp. 2_MG-2023]
MGINKDQVLITWVGGNDLKALDSAAASPGPIASALATLSVDAIELLYNYPDADVKPYLKWLAGRTQATIRAHKVKLTSPVDYDSVYQVSSQYLQALSATKADLSILLSPGTPTMQAVWVLLGKTRYPCCFYQSSREAGVEEVSIPFQLSAEYIPTASSLNSAKISQLAQGDAPVDAAFDHIVTQSPRMQTLKAQAQILAEREV